MLDEIVIHEVQRNIDYQQVFDTAKKQSYFCKTCEYQQFNVTTGDYFCNCASDKRQSYLEKCPALIAIASQLDSPEYLSKIITYGLSMSIKLDSPT